MSNNFIYPFLHFIYSNTKILGKTDFEIKNSLFNKLRSN